MRLHAVCLPHLDPIREVEWCAYSQKIRRFGGMLAQCGHELVTYGGPESDADGEHVQILDEDDRARWFPGRDWSVEVFDKWDPGHSAWQEMSSRAIAAIRDRIEPTDMVGIIAGRCQHAIAEAFPDHRALEWGVGYSGVLPTTFRCFESHAWRHHVAALNHDDRHRFYDTVIPNAFDPDDITYSPDHGGYALYLGRLNHDKGVQIAIDAAALAGVPLIAAGQGNPAAFDHKGDVSFVGVITGADKTLALSRAQVLLAPTTYLEPFGGVAVEAMLSGTPAVTTDWGAFTETVDHGVSGWRCNTLGEFAQAIRLSADLDRAAVAAHAQRYTTKSVAHLYDDWFTQLAGLATTGWYDEDPGRLRA